MDDRTMLFKFRESQLMDLGLARARNRPRRTEECSSIQDAEHWRNDVVKELSLKITKIMDPALNEFQIREINDEINRLLATRYRWEMRLIELGGPDLRRSGARMITEDGLELPGGGYKYFGRAKELPGVKELFEAARPKAVPSVKKDLLKRVDVDYYGHRDEEDGVLVSVEAEHELQSRGTTSSQMDEQLFNVDIPSQREVEAYLVEWRKQALLSKYTTSQ